MAIKRFSEFRKGNDRIKVYAKGFNSNRSVQLTGNVTGSAQSDLDEGTTLSIATTIADNAVTNSKLSDGAVSTSKLNDDAVTSAKIDTGAVTVNKLGASAVETDKIANGAVTLQKISSSAIDNEPTDASGNLITSGGVKAALDDLDSEVTSNDGINVQAKVTEVDGKITALNITTDNTENRNNKVTSWQVTPDNTHYPSEKLVKDGLDAKADANNVVAIADAKVYRSGQSGSGWYKIAECSLNKGTRNISASWDVLAVNQNYSNGGHISLNYRYENSTGTFSRTNVCLYVDSWDSTRNLIKVARQITSDKIIVEIWVNSSDTYSGFAISERNSDNFSVDNVKEIWTYTSYIGNGGSSAPVTDATNNVVVTDVDIVARQHAIASPTNDNLVAMDASGLVKDSGKSVLLGTQTWDGTSDAKLPTPKAVQGAIDAKVKGNADVSSMGTDDTHAYSGKAVSTAISNAISGTTGGFLGEKTIAEMNAYTNPKMGDNALISNTGTITIGNTPCVISQAPAEVRWTTDGSWIETSAGYVRDTKVATTQELGLVKTNPTNGGVILNNNNQMVVQGWDDKASSSDVTSLAGRVTTAEGDITALQSSVAGKLNASDAVWTIDDSDDAIIVDDEFMTWMFQA